MDTIKIKPFKLKQKYTGILLKIHHTFATETGEIKRLPMCAADFNQYNDRLVAIDCRGNIYVFDMNGMHFWVLPEIVPHPSILKCVPGPKSNQQIIVGTKYGELVCVNIDKITKKNITTNNASSRTNDNNNNNNSNNNTNDNNGSNKDDDIRRRITNKSQLFSTKLKHISFPDTTTDVFLATTRCEAIIVDSKTFESKQKLEFPSTITPTKIQTNTTTQLFGSASGNSVTTNNENEDDGNDNYDFSISQRNKYSSGGGSGGGGVGGDGGVTQLGIKQIAFIPNSDQLYGCFSDNSIHIWATYSFELLKHVYPIKARELYLKNSKAIVIDLKTKTTNNFNANFNSSNKNDDDNVDVDADDDGNNDYDDNTNYLEMLKFNKIVTKDFSHGFINDICFSSNGCYMCVSTIDNTLMVFSTITWNMEILLETPQITVNQCEFIPLQQKIYHRLSQQTSNDDAGGTDGVNSVDDADSDDNQTKQKQKQNYGVLAIVTSLHDTVLLDLDHLMCKIFIENSQTNSLSIAKNSILMSIVRRTGEVYLYNLRVLLSKLSEQKFHLNDTELKNKQNPNTVEYNQENVQIELKKHLSLKRIQAILNNFYEYPKKYRQLIWQTLLELPNNSIEFNELVKRGYHKCTENYSELFPLKDEEIFNNLKLIVSCLANWSKLFVQTKFIANFVFPFLKLYPNDLLVCFETILTILINHGQLWFEFSPLEPINYLGMCENLLAHYEPKLLKFYKKNQITNSIYAWSLIQTGFTEVLDEQQWFSLWDNIISNPSYFLIFSVISYNKIMSTQIQKLPNQISIENFFQEQNIIDIRKLITISYELMTKCPIELHPKQFMYNFQPLQKQNYQKFTNYPKQFINGNNNDGNNEIDRLQSQNRLLNQKFYELERIEQNVSEKIADESRKIEHEKRMREVEQNYQEAIQREENRVAYQKKHLLLCQKQLRERELRIFELANKTANEKMLKHRENELDALLHNFQRDRLRDENDLMFAEEQLKIRETNLLIDKYRLESSHTEDQSLNTRYDKAIRKLNTEKHELTDELDKIKNHNSRNPTPEIIMKTNAIKDMLQQIQIEFSKITELKNNNDDDKQYKNNKIQNLELKTRQLEEEVKNLLKTTTATTTRTTTTRM